MRYDTKVLYIQPMISVASPVTNQLGYFIFDYLQTSDQFSVQIQEQEQNRLL